MSKFISLKKDYFSDPIWCFAIAAALLLHAVLIMVSFLAPSADRAVMQDIAIAVHLSPQKVENADFLAQNDQQGSGVLRNTHRMTSPSQQAAKQDQQEIAENLNLHSEKRVQPSQSAEQILVTTLSWQKETRNKERKKAAKKQSESSPDMAQVAMIATLEAQYAKRKQEYTRKTKIHTVDSVSAKAEKTATYMDRFRLKVERLGNKHYPAEAIQKHLQGEVRLMVILRPNGRIRAIRLMQTSGHAVLDEAAKDSVRQAAPFDAFDNKMKDYTELRILRTWRFSDKTQDVEVAFDDYDR